MEKEEVEILVNLRQKILEKFNRLRDYKNNKNAIMKEIEHAGVLHDIIVEIDKVFIEHAVREHVGLEVSTGHRAHHVKEFEGSNHRGSEHHNDGGLNHRHRHRAE